MKYLILFMLLIPANKIIAQLKPDNMAPATKILPEGTALKNGVITVLPGYKAIVSNKDNKVILIQRTTNTRMSRTGAISGTFTCTCNQDHATNDCVTALRNDAIICVGKTCTKCDLYINIKPTAGAAITRETKGEIWKRFDRGKVD